MKYIKFVLLILLILSAAITRLYGLDRTARFIWDESSDLVNMHQIFVERNLTMVGPISEQGDKVFGSLTYYMLLPFAAIFSFDPIGPVYGAVFWSFVIIINIIILGRRINPGKVWLVAVLSVFWFPLVDMGRWAWNPNLIPFWIFLGIILTGSQSKFLIFLGGLAMGMSVHHHYLSIFAIAAYGVFYLFSDLRNGGKLFALTFILGVVFSLVPFVVFDITHPPGLFISRLLYFNHIDSQLSFAVFGQRFAEVLGSFCTYFFGDGWFGYVLFILTFVLLIEDIMKRSESLKYAFPWILQVLLLVVITPFNTHYLIPAVGFFITWLMFKREKPFSLVANIVMIGMAISGLIAFYWQLNTYNWMADIRSTRTISGILVSEIISSDLKNVNIAVVSSPDQNIYGRKFRDLLLLKNINLLSKDHYGITDNLFVVSTSPESAVRSDPAHEMSRFKDGVIVNTWKVDKSPWNVYLFQLKAQR